MHIFIRLTFIILFVFPSLSCFSHLVWYHYLCHFNSHPPPPPRCIDFQTRNKNKPTVKHTENCHSSPRTPQAKEHSAKGRRHMEGVYCSRCCSRSSLCRCLQKKGGLENRSCSRIYCPSTYTHTCIRSRPNVCFR